MIFEQSWRPSYYGQKFCVLHFEQILPKKIWAYWASFSNRSYHWLHYISGDSETTERQSFLRVEEGSLSRVLAFDCGQEEYVVKREILSRRYCLILVFVMCRKAFGKAKQGDESAHSAAHVLRREYEKLGPISYVTLYLWKDESTCSVVYYCMSASVVLQTSLLKIIRGCGYKFFEIVKIWHVFENILIK